MSRTKEIATAAGTLACALGIGFVMQSTDSASQRYGTAKPQDASSAPVATPEKAERSKGATVMDVSGITLTSAMPDADIHPGMADLPIRRDIKQAGMLPFPPEQSTKPTVSQTSCDIGFTATPEAAAFVSLSLTANCLPNAAVSIHHNGMVFTTSTDETGRLQVSVPALSDNALFMAAIAGQDMVSAKAEVTDLNSYNRIVLQWEGAAGFELHAREFGAEYGAKGHIWRGSDMDNGNLIKGQGGYLVHLGDRTMPDASLVEVYTFPASMSGNNGQIDLSVEAQVTLANCGLDIEAHTLELGAERALQSRNVIFSVPGCDTVGDYLVLNNVFEDLKLAAK